MEIIKAYKTEDGKIHDSKIEAVKHEYWLTMRGILQGAIARPVNVTTSTVAKDIIDNAEEIKATIIRFNARIKALESLVANNP